MAETHMGGTDPQPGRSPIAISAGQAESAAGDSSGESRLLAPFSIVGIGASAGGLEPFIHLLRDLPSDTGLGFVFVQHLAPSHPSVLAEILSRVTSMPVMEVRDEPLALPNHVYVIPPGRNMTIVHGAFRLWPREAHGQQRPIDMFFQSLAQDMGHQAIGVVLSGSATDGTLGLEAIKAEGGITFAQDDTAQQPSMPRSAIAAGCVDFVLPPHEIAREIARIARHPYVQPETSRVEPLERSTLERIVQVLRQETGVDFAHYKTNTLHRRIARRIILHRLEGWPEYVQFLEGSPSEVAALHKDILIGVTKFFRDPDAFEALQTAVFPRLLEDRTRDDPLRIWVLGCSTGEEAYSLAMALTEGLDPAGHPTAIQVFATDLSAPAIASARAGVYTKSAAQDVSPGRLQRFFLEVDGSYRVAKSIRDLCVFARHNVLVDPPFSRVDLISCRNLLIYLEPAVQQRMVAILHYALKPRGFLWLGAAETIGSHRDLFEVENAAHRIFTKRPGTRLHAVHRPLRLAKTGPASAVERLDRPGTVSAVDVRKEAERLLVGRFAPPGVLVSADMEILQVWGDTGPYLAPAPGKASLNLLKMLREGLLVSVRDLVVRARTAGRTTRVEGLRVTSNGTPRDVSVEVVPLGGSSAHDSAFLVLFEDASGTRPAPSFSTAELEPKETGPGTLVSEGLEDEVSRLTRELNATREYLQAVIEQQEAANEELQSSHEEAQSTNEELQSINEELETSKEEIQSSNEEMTTVNDELNYRNLELGRTNNDLTNLLASVQMAIIILGRDLRIRRFTSTSEEMFNLIPADLGRRVRDIRLGSSLLDLEALVAESIDTLSVVEREVQDGQGRWHLLRIRPYKTLENQIDGAVMVVVDIDALKRMHEYTDAIVATVRAPLLVLDRNLQVRMASAAFYDMFDVARTATEGRILFELGSGQWNVPLLRQLLEEVLTRDQQINDFEVDIALEGGVRKSLLLNARRLVATSSSAPSILLGIEDVTARRTLEAAADQRIAELAAADRAKDEFLAMLGHELRNPLGALGNALQLTRHPAADAATTVRAWDVMNRQVQSLTRLVDDLLDVARLAQGRIDVHKEVIDLGLVVGRAVESIEPAVVARAQEMVVSRPTAPLYVDADPIRMEQVVGNLLNNASKFTPRGGHVWVTLEVANDEGGTVPGEAVVGVRDDGIGIDPELLPRVYDLFTQAEHSLARSHGGLGIGLTIVQRIVELHGGRVEARSGGRDRGSEFLVRLPVVRRGELGRNRSMGAPSTPEGDTVRRRVLVVDDSQDSAEGLAAFFRMSGHEVRVALDGARAVEVASTFLPEVVLLDIGLPGMSGYEVAKQVRALPGMSQALLIALTGYGQERDRELSRQAGLDQHLTKPADHALLSRLLRSPAPR